MLLRLVLLLMGCRRVCMLRSIHITRYPICDGFNCKMKSTKHLYLLSCRVPATRSCRHATGHTSTMRLLLTLLSLSYLLSPSKGDANKDYLEYFLLEELPRGTLIGNIWTDGQLDHIYDNDTLSVLRFSILSQPNSHDDLFAIDAVTGVVRTSKKIDRDSLCPQQDTCNVWLHIATHPAQVFQVFKILVTILDSNDNQPVFPATTIDLQISEATLPGTMFALPAAVDIDAGDNGVRSYDINDNGHFAIEVEFNELDGSTDLKLVLTQVLDREQQATHNLIVIAIDGGRPAHTGSVLVNIQVEDDNDNQPVFSNATYEVLVPESTEPGAAIYRVEANDKDEGANGQILYRLSSGSTLLYGSLFSVDQVSGDILLKAALDYETKQLYVLTIEASDLGKIQKTGKCTVLIKVGDVNDNTPYISLNTLTDTKAAEVIENSPVGTFVAHLSVADADAGANGKVECVLSHPAFQIEQLYPGQFKVITREVMDREQKDSYLIAIVCLDQGQPVKMSTINITVHVTDVNDHAPEFEKTLYETAIQENNALDEVLLDVKASDPDEGDNGKIRYSLHPEDVSRLFNIHPLTGLISTNAIFDHETMTEVTFKVLATDNGKPSMTSTATVLLSILDLNDEPPRFLKDSYDFGTFENQPIGTEVGSVVAVDADEVSNLKYSITDFDDDVTKDSFVIDPIFGRISTTVVLDREERQKYWMTVTVVSEVFPPMTSSVNVTVHVADINDNSPVILYPSPENDTINISAYDIIGSKITKINAEDLDIGTNAKLWYSIQSGNDNNLFWIDPTSGSIAIHNALTDNAGATINLVIHVEDSGHHRLFTTATLKVSIKPVKSQKLMYSQDTRDHHGNTIVIALTLVSLLVIIILTVAIIIMWRKGLLCKHIKTTETVPASPAKPGESQRMLNSFTMISFLRDNEVLNDKDKTLNNVQQDNVLNNAPKVQNYRNCSIRQVVCQEYKLEGIPPGSRQEDSCVVDVDVPDVQRQLVKVTSFGKATPESLPDATLEESQQEFIA